jgi:hypothetical protein
VGPRAGLDTEATGQIISPLPGIELLSPGRSARSSLTDKEERGTQSQFS